jgi:hypothetical protein
MAEASMPGDFFFRFFELVLLADFFALRAIADPSIPNRNCDTEFLPRMIRA